VINPPEKSDDDEENREEECEETSEIGFSTLLGSETWSFLSFVRSELEKDADEDDNLALLVVLLIPILILP